MKKIFAICLAVAMCLCVASCGADTSKIKVETPIDIDDKEVLTPHIEGNYRIDFEDEEFANYVVARVGEEYFYWTNRDTTMHYYHKTANGWDEYTNNASTEDGYTKEAVAHHDSMDKLLKEHFKVLTHTNGIAMDDEVPSTGTYYGLICHKYEDGDDYTYISTDYNIIVESRRRVGDSEYFSGLSRGNESMKVGDKYKGFDDEKMVPEQFRKSVSIVVPVTTTVANETRKQS